MSRYERELAALPHTYQAALEWDVEPLARLIGLLSTQGLRVVGSGGSFSLAAFCARLHAAVTQFPGYAVTPLEVVRGPFLHDSGLLCVTASGRNKDIRAAFEAAAVAEVKPTAAFCLAAETPIKALSDRYSFTDVVEAPLEIESDGFLAVNSLLASCVLLVRAYRRLSADEVALPATFEALMAHAEAPGDFDELLRTVLSRRTTSLLFSPAVSAAAVDLESRFVEGALGNLHIADWRNFGHGRHHWLAKRERETGLLALSGSADASLARRTLATIPAEIPRAVVTFSGPPDVQLVCAMVMALRVAGVAGEIAGIDPGRPGVPEFGRKLFGLGPRVETPSAEEAAIQRKVRVAPEIEGVIRERYTRVRGQVREAAAHGVVLDYDGTLCDRRRRWDPLEKDMADALAAIAETGALIGIATGRGQSAAVELERVIPRSAWERVLIGYYNGAVIEPLGRRPPKIDQVNAVARQVGERLADWFPAAELDVREWQVSANGFRHGRLPAIAHTAARLLAGEGLPSYVVCSSHSIDVLLTEQRKAAVVGALRQLTGQTSAQFFRIGDRGTWPGNDFDLLADPLGLSVDEVSRSPNTCWNLAPPGALGPQATVYYLTRLRTGPDGLLRLDLD